MADVQIAVSLAGIQQVQGGLQQLQGRLQSTAKVGAPVPPRVKLRRQRRGFARKLMHPVPPSVVESISALDVLNAAAIREFWRM